MRGLINFGYALLGIRLEGSHVFWVRRRGSFGIGGASIEFVCKRVCRSRKMLCFCSVVYNLCGGGKSVKLKCIGFMTIGSQGIVDCK